jgi:hypothetical protein
MPEGYLWQHQYIQLAEEPAVGRFGDVLSIDIGFKVNWGFHSCLRSRSWPRIPGLNL